MSEAPLDLSLQGGPLDWLRHRVVANPRKSGAFAFGLMLGGGLWAVLMGLAAYEGIAGRLLSLEVIAGHARLLLVIPLLFVAEAAFIPEARNFIRSLESAGIVQGDEISRLNRLVARVNALARGWWPDFLFLIAAIAVLVLHPGLISLGASTSVDLENGIGDRPLAGLWYWFVCLTVLRVVILRWVWRIGLWLYLLWAIPNLRLDLQTMHPDGVGGLGYLAVVQGSFRYLLLAISTVVAASFAEAIVVSEMTVEGAYFPVALLMIVYAVLFIAPLYFFVSQLRSANARARAHHGAFSAQFVRRFEEKWLRTDNVDWDAALGSGDFQSLADMRDSFGAVEGNKLAPFSYSALVPFMVWSLTPFFFLVFFQFPVDEVFVRLMRMVIGL